MPHPDIVLCGNVFLDQVYVLDGFPRRNQTNLASVTYTSVGGIVNVAKNLRDLGGHDLALQTALGDDLTGREVWQDLLGLGVDLEQVQTVPGAQTTKATILVDKKSGERSSVVHWGACTRHRYFQAAPARWHHLAYLDCLRGLRAEDLTAMRRAGATLSGDLCLAEHDAATARRMLTLIPELDWLLISDVECRALLDHAGPQSAQLLGKMVRRWAVVHHAKGSWASNGRETVTTDIQPDTSVSDLLGAGDAFAAALIHGALRRGASEPAIPSLLQQAHDFAAETLKCHRPEVQRA